MEIFLVLILPVFVLSWIVAKVGRRAWLGYLHLILTPVLIGGAFVLLLAFSDLAGLERAIRAALWAIGGGYLISFLLHLLLALYLRSPGRAERRSMP